MIANQLTVDDPKEASRAERHFTKSATNVELQGQFISEHKLISWVDEQFLPMFGHPYLGEPQPEQGNEWIHKMWV